MKKTTSDFINAEPTQKEVMLNDGLKYLTNQLNEDVQSITRLFKWMTLYNALISLDELKLANKKETIKRIDQLNVSIDDLIDTCITLSARMNRIRKQVIK